MKKKRIIKIIFFSFVILFTTFVGYKIIIKSQEKKLINKNINIIPEINFVGLDSLKFKKGNLKLNLPTVFLYFNSKCDFCKYEAQSIAQSINEFKNIQLVFVSTESIEKIKLFSEHYKLNNRENIIFLNDNKDVFSETFNATSIPYTLIYDKKQKLIKAHRGQFNAAGILRVINELD